MNIGAKQILLTKRELEMFEWLYYKIVFSVNAGLTTLDYIGQCIGTTPESIIGNIYSCTIR